MENCVDNRFVIVLCEEHYTPLGVIRTLGEAGCSPAVVIKRNPRMRIASKSKWIGAIRFVDTYEEGLRYIEKKYGHGVKRDVIIPCDDGAVKCIEEQYDRLSSRFIFNNADKNGRIAFFQNKDEQYKIARKYGLEVAITWHVKTGEIPNDIQYPIITKPMRSYEGWKQDYYVCRNDVELLAAFDRIKAPEVLLQRYVDKVTERTYEGVSVDHGRDVFFSIQTRYTYKLPDYYSMEMIVSSPDDQAVQKALGDMLEEIGFEGIFEVEFMEDAEGRLWFLEINFRNSTWSWASTKLGMPLPILWIKGMDDGCIPQNAQREVPQNYRALAEQADFHFRVRQTKQLTLFDWVRSVRTADCLYFWDHHDKAPCFWSWMWVIRGFIAKRLRLT